MPEKLIVAVASQEDPSKSFLICDINDGRVFEDPMILFSHPEYDVDNINEDGLYAVGGELDIETLLAAYKWGIFPWYPHKYYDMPFWHCPKERFVLFPDKVHISHSLRNLLNKNKYHITIDKDFRGVIHNCRMIDDRDENVMSWLGEKLENLFIELHEMGYAKSVELWEGDELVGGFYGFWQHGIFQGESMFSLQPSASQIALVLLCNNPYINGEKIKLIDTQFETPTFRRLGAQYIPYQIYRDLMEN
ncbi:MAG: leucyl/phenylalanyl-tRNA--protein transferase [Muribaculaceae bacterium]|nr:leucyl/phenylalanyl-tRNA--protein transferase [Muribaculaceae bacterium]